MSAIRDTASQKVFKVFNAIFLSLFALSTVYPFWYVLVASFNDGRDFSKGGVYLLPRLFTLENYIIAFQNKQIVTAFSISVFRTVLGVILGVALTALLAYAISIRSLPGRTGLSLFFYFTTIFSGGMVPYFMLLRDLGLTKSVWIYVIPSLYSFFNMLLMRTYFDTVPKEIREAAQIDGAGEARILFQIYLPLSMPIIATIALFIGVGQWNEWFTGAYYVSNQDIIPAATLLQKILNEAMSQTVIKQGQENAGMALVKSYTPQSLQMAFVMILTMPIIVVYPFLQKYYVKGVMIGSVKG